MKHPTILGIDPGTKEMGLAVLRGKELRFFGVRALRNGKRPYDVIGQARHVVLNAIETYEPDIVAIEQPFNLATTRSHVLNVIADELYERVREIGLKLVVLPPDVIRLRVVGNPLATKIEVAQVLVDRGFEQLRALIPKPPARAALGLRPKDKYWLHMFDALALALAAGGSGTESQSPSRKDQDRSAPAFHPSSTAAR